MKEAATRMEAMRDTIFISHANPEDNEFTQWLSLQLSLQGYAVWSDVTKLIGGEDFWVDIESAIRDRTIKFLFVASRASKTKQGALNELAVALTVARQISIHDFIIPIRIDDLPFSEFSIQIHRLNGIDFHGNWAMGLAKLLKKLNEDTVPRDEAKFNASTIRSWWDANHLGEEIVKHEPEVLLSNWLPVEDLPSQVFLHTDKIKQNSRMGFRFPAHRIGSSTLSFATAEELGLTQVDSTQYATKDVLAGSIQDAPLNGEQCQFALLRVLRVSWDRAMSDAGLALHEMASKKRCRYFNRTHFKGKEFVPFENSGFKGRRTLIGKLKENQWHYGLSAEVRIDPFLLLALYPHVLATTNGSTLLSSAAKLHAARRSACKDWWNAEWRDRQLACLQWLANKNDGKSILVRLSSSLSFDVPITPIQFRSPLSYSEESLKRDEDPPEDPAFEEATLNQVEGP
ncbi:toll/interleukin-1 receptor domain-containing protein [Geothrix fuzhouensis]|uniref:toll/interleukin-1 receptor domain-containing protein n=1 Tax=Geothrix fuzhouensis TaxID=2966451 RepID=UPI0021475F01|nr:toll/interleukin-1 receptor domain-containing protein [Geothrix fuzhouensis]